MSVTPSIQRRALLIVEDESIVAHDLKQLLTSFHYDAYAIAASAEEALARAAERRPDLALVDVRLKGRTDGIRASQLLRERFGVPVIYLTAHAEPATLERAKLTRPYGYLVKPVNPAELRSSIEVALYRHDMETEERRSTAAATLDAPRPAARHSRAPSPRAVRRQVETLLLSPDFDAPRRSREFLRFIVEETLSGRGEELTQAAIATQAFGRKDDFDALVDPIVRIQAGRLRRSLERYYLLSGKQDPLRIELPRGSYVPAFHVQAEPEPAAAEPFRAAAGLDAPADDWPAMSIRSFEAAAPEPELQAAASLLNEELFLELGRYRDVRTLRQPEPEDLPALTQEHARFSLRGSVRRENGNVRVSAHLVDHAKGAQVWGDTYDTAPGTDRWSGPPEDIARVIAARIGAEEGVVAQLMAAEYKKAAPRPGTAYAAMLLSYEFFLARDIRVLAGAIEALQRIVEADPGCGPAWTRLARLFLANHNFELTTLSTPLEQALLYAHQGVRVDASSRPARCILATVLLNKGELGAARAELEEALRLSPDSLVYLEIIGFLLTLAGDWERGAALSRSAKARNPHCLPHVLFGLWADHLRRGDNEAAYRNALEYRDPTFFWRSVMVASCLGNLGRDATAEVAELLRCKPDFAARGRILVGRYIKFPEVMDRIVEGLARVGLTLA